MKSLLKNLQDNGLTAELEILPGLEHADGMKERVQAAQRFFERYAKG